jgi:hypothetical protein
MTQNINGLNQDLRRMNHDLHIALYQPEIPGNTGAILQARRLLWRNRRHY